MSTFCTLLPVISQFSCQAESKNRETLNLSTKDHIFGVNNQISQGSYSVLLPDGRLQTVEYSVLGEGGYKAKVFYS